MNVTAASSLVLAAEEPNPLLPHPGEIILGIVVFLILVLLVRRFVVPNFEKAYADRTEAIEGGIARAEQAQAEADAALAQYRSQLADARHESSRIREEAKEQGATILAEMRQQAQTEAQRIVSTAHSQIEAERKQVVLQLRSEIGSLATSLAERIVGESLQDEVRQRRTVERFLAELESRDEAAAQESAQDSAQEPAQQSAQESTQSSTGPAADGSTDASTADDPSADRGGPHGSTAAPVGER